MVDDMPTFQLKVLPATDICRAVIAEKMVAPLQGDATLLKLLFYHIFFSLCVCIDVLKMWHSSDIWERL
jgi:hypothetical protein